MPLQKGIEWAWPIYGLVVGPFCLILGIGFVLISTANMGNLRIYEKGITIPDRTIFQILQRKKENFISFIDIESIYLNRRKKLSYIVIKKRGGKWRQKLSVIYKKDIEYDKNIDTFKKLLEAKVKIIEDKVWILGKGENHTIIPLL